MVSTYPEYRLIHYGKDPAQFGELWQPAGSQSVPPAGTVVIVHGGFWRARYDLSLGRRL
jgi:acetyl esterase/lipase